MNVLGIRLGGYLTSLKVKLMQIDVRCINMNSATVALGVDLTGPFSIVVSILIASKRISRLIFLGNILEILILTTWQIVILD